MLGMQYIEQHTQHDHTQEINKQTNCDTTLLEDVGVPCALMCMLAVPVSIVVQAIALCCSWGAVVCSCEVDSPFTGMLCTHTWNIMQYSNPP